MSLEFNARVDYKYQGGDTIFSVPFPYINKSHIVIIINGDTENPTRNFTWLSEDQIQLKDEINTGDIVSVRRITPIENKIVVFEDNNILDEETQNLAQDQVFNVVQEVKDGQDNLNANMQEFIELKDVVNEQMQTIQEVAVSAEKANELNQDTRELVNDIANTYEQIQDNIANGLNANITHNLFAIEVFDKTLNDTEAIGWAEQDNTVTVQDYPAAYETLVQEYNEGTKKIYADENTSVYVKQYKLDDGSIIYTSSDVDLVEGTEVYSDINLTESLGKITSANNLTVDKYLKGEDTNFFVTKDTELEVGTTLYSNKYLTETLGTITDIKQALAYKFQGTSSGVFYISALEEIHRGTKVYSDVLCTKEKGTVTFVGTKAVDKYTVKGSEQVTEFYVAKDTVIATGVEIFADKFLSQSLGKITAKGIQQDTASYYYKLTNPRGDGYLPSKATYFYNSEIIKAKGNYAWYMYKDKICTERYYHYYTKDAYLEGLFAVGDTSTGKTVTVCPVVSVGHRIMLGTGGDLELVSSTTNTTSSYITITGSTDKLSYYKQATIEDVDTIAINDGDYEGYLLKETLANEVIQIDNGEYETYKKTDVLDISTLSIASGGLKQVVANTIEVTSGVAFEYMLHSNGHKIVLSKYKNVVNNLKETNNKSEYYILDKDNQTFTLPLLDKTKKIYFCVGNTLKINSPIDIVTKTYLSQMGYISASNEEMQKLVEFIQSSADALINIDKVLKEAEEAVNEISKEF